MCIGVQTYAVYVGSLWYYDETGKKGYPYAAGPIIGIGAGMVFITAGYVATGYPEEREKGSYATILMNMQALGSVISGIIPVIINRNSDTVAGVPRSVYIAFIVIMVIGGLLCLALLRPHKLTRDDGSVVAVDRPRGVWEELRTNLLVFTDPVLLMMLPAFLPAEGFLVYSGSVNGRPSGDVHKPKLTPSQLSITISVHAHYFPSSLLSCRYQQGGHCNTFWTTQGGVAASADLSA
jgi:MFS family permease